MTNNNCGCQCSCEDSTKNARKTLSISRIILFNLAILFGVFMFVYGGYDDSPGGQGLGLVAVIAGIVGIIKSKKKTSN